MGNIKTSIYDTSTNESPGAVVPRDPTQEDMSTLLPHVLKESIGEDQVIQWLSEVDGFLELALEPEKMDMLSSTGEWEWDLYQLEYFRVVSSFICNKCRQSGGSAMLSAKGFGKGILSAVPYNMILTSYKKEEAINKIDYVRQYLAALPPTFRKKIIREPRQLIEFENANGTRVKILSHAQKPIRGINGDVGLDELAFYQWAKEVYDSAGPATGMVKGVVDIISTPFGKSGVFYEIFSDTNKFPDYRRMPIMWWFCLRYLKEPTPEFAAQAYKLAPYMTTEERVHTFGNSFLIGQFNKSTDLETFQQEFEGLFVDAQAAFFTKDEILAVMFQDEQDTSRDYDPLETDFEIAIEDALEEEAFSMSPIERYYHERGVRDRFGKKILFKKFDSIIDLHNAYRNPKVNVGQQLYAGLDIGVTRHSSHFVIMEEVFLDNGETLMIERYSENIQNERLSVQKDKYASYLKLGMIKKMYADATGVGRGIAEDLESLFPRLFEPFIFTNKTKEQVYVNMKYRMSHQKMALASNKLTIDSIYSINRYVGETGTVTFKAEEKKRHHGDASDAIALALWCGRRYGEGPSIITSATAQAERVGNTIKKQSLNDRLNRIGKMRRSSSSRIFNPGKFRDF